MNAAGQPNGVLRVLIGGKGNNPSSLGVNSSKKLFAPRVGFAYRLGSDTVIRGGYGITYDPMPFGRPLRGFYPATVAQTFVATGPGANETFTPWGFNDATNRIAGLTLGIPNFTGPDLSSGVVSLPGTLWILIGVVLGGAVQDFVILFASMRRDGKSLAQMVREELNRGAGTIGVIAILSIMIILLAVLALVVVNALAESPWGVFTVGATIPIAMFMGGYLRWLRVGKVMEASVIGVILLLLAVVGGQWVSDNATLKELFHLNAPTLAWSVIIYAFAASVLPVWLLLAPRDYLSTFMKLGTIFLLAGSQLLAWFERKTAPLTWVISYASPYSVATLSDVVAGNAARDTDAVRSFVLNACLMSELFRIFGHSWSPLPPDILCE